MQRRDFLKKSFIIGSSLVVAKSIPLACTTTTPIKNTKSKIIISRDENLQSGQKSVDSNKLSQLLDKAMQTLFHCDNELEPWKRIVNPGEVIGLKVNCLSGHGSTNTVLVDLICERLQQAGIHAGDIIIWDRLNSDLEDGGFQVNSQGNRIKCFGNDTSGFEDNLQVSGSIASLVSRTVTRICDAVINLPVLKDHGIAGVTISLKNFFGAIHNPNKYHMHVGDPYIPDVYMLPSIKNKVRLTICDAITAQYDGGPSFMPQWTWPFNGLIVGLDPVAVDYTGWQIIERKRMEVGKRSLKEMGREPIYIATAADIKHQLGISDPAQIELIELNNS
jgi:uncharacterized protein (DUF362 family)